MKSKTLSHFSHDFELDLDKRPTKKSDRMTLKIILPGMLFGFVLAGLGVYEFLLRNFPQLFEFGDFTFAEKIELNSFLSPTFFDLAIIALGLWVMLSSFFSYIRYKKIFFDGKKFRVVNRPAFGKKKAFEEDLKSYEGVLFRIEFFQFGIMNRNKYIIELKHRNVEKTVPLYISTSGKNIRIFWEYYAKKLKMPAIMMSDEGVIKRDIKDFGKSVIQMVKAGKIKNDFKEGKRIPKMIAYTRKKDKTIIKVRELVWDAYNIITLGISFIFFISISAMAVTAPNHGAAFRSCLFVLALLAVLTFLMFRKDKIVIKKHKVIIVHKFMLFSRKKDEIMKNNIKAVDVSFNPALERYFLAITGDNRTLVFGKKLPLESLKWVRDFLISEIVK